MHSLFPATILICFGSALQAGDQENPFRKGAVGDWVEYAMTGPNMEGKTKMTIVAKDDKEVTYEVAATFAFMGKEMVAPVQKMKIDLTKSYDPIATANLKAKDVKIEREGEGAEKVKVGQKEFDTKWTKLKATATVNNFMVVTDYKMWFSKDVPLSGLVRMETTTSMLTTKLELIGTGHK